MNYFVAPGSIVRQVWGKGDTILFIFAGAAAEFALNKAVDWLYFTGRLPADPLGRLFSTVAYARQIVFSEEETAFKAIDRIRAIHTGVEQARKDVIPDWAYRDVLYLLIHYSIAAQEVLEKKLSPDEKEELYRVFLRIGTRMGIPGLPPDYHSWLPERDRHLERDLEKSRYTEDLFRQYRKHLGPVRYLLLQQAQILVVPPHVRRLLRLSPPYLVRPLITLYKGSRLIGADYLLKELILPAEYKKQIRDLDRPPAERAGAKQ
ncbi:MAG TPA: oxygenase MpaB family protein [Chitinophagaceae bacterium]|jgi:uncharacterized protein (DUF2236 family)|nr:oxygenase MpaB family protein [Chitinophagaceae bacterium]